MELTGKFNTSFISISLMFFATSGITNELFRYLDESGNVVINNRIPAGNVAKGYDIIDKKGRIIKTVPRESTPRELENKQKEATLQEVELSSQNRQAAYDLALLRKFSFVSDIRAEQERKAAEIEVRIRILEGNLKNLRTEVGKEYQKAANLERASANVGEALKGRIAQFETRIMSTQALLTKQQQGLIELHRHYERSIERFQKLLAMKNQSRTRNGQ